MRCAAPASLPRPRLPPLLLLLHPRLGSLRLLAVPDRLFDFRAGGKALMLVHVPEHPTETTYLESLRALRLASQGASCEIALKPAKRAGGAAGGRAKRQKA
jgi:hypothetical protein